MLRSVTCPFCKRGIDEAQAQWDKAQNTGRCPYCGHFYDPDSEARAMAALAADPDLPGRLRPFRIMALLLGAGLVGAGALLDFHEGLLSLGGALVLWGLLFDATKHALAGASKRTDLSRFGDRK